jgi:hypothetical protein
VRVIVMQGPEQDAVTTVITSSDEVLSQVSQAFMADISSHDDILIVAEYDSENVQVIVDGVDIESPQEETLL